MLTAAGEVNYYGEVERAAVASVVATRLDISPSRVSVTIGVASVRLFVIIDFEDAARSDAAAQSLRALLPDTDSATAVLGIPVQDVPAISSTVLTLGPAAPPYMPHPARPLTLAANDVAGLVGRDAATPIFPLLLGGLAGAGGLVTAVLAVRRRRSLAQARWAGGVVRGLRNRTTGEAPSLKCHSAEMAAAEFSSQYDMTKGTTTRIVQARMVPQDEGTTGSPQDHPPPYTAPVPHRNAFTVEHIGGEPL